MGKKKTIENAELAGKRLLMRVDFNVPLDENQQITDDKRIKATLPTIKYGSEAGAKVILMSHLGRPKGTRVPDMSLKPAAVRLGELLGREVAFAPDCIGEETEAMVNAMKDGDVLLLENVRFHAEETKNDPEFSRRLSRLGDIYANDAFGSAHRAHGSTVGVAELFDTRLSGYLMEKELKFLDEAVKNPERPFIAILGGAKISDKIPVIENLIDKVDKLIIGGGMAYTFMKAQGLEIGNSLLDEASIPMVERLLEETDKLVLPVDTVVTDALNIKERQLGQIRTVDIAGIPAEWVGVDIGPKTIEKFKAALSGARTIVWNGPMGIFEMEQTARGTMAIAEMMAELTDCGATTIIGGGDSASAVKKAGLSARMSHVSTGGGASLEFLQGKALPGVNVLSDV